MPHKDPETRREFMRQYQLTWMWRRRLQWILDNGPCSWCGSVNGLSVSYKNPAKKKVHVSSIWSRTDEKRAELLKDCEVLCSDCHRKKMAIWRVLRTTLKPPDQ
ncbi:MAG TPA: hypothetical protein VIV15_07020 [Anaerolineales bacterium]